MEVTLKHPRPLLSSQHRVPSEIKETTLFSGFPGLTLATIFFGFIRNLFLFSVLVKCAQSLHNRMFKALLGTPVRFFDINPIGELVVGDETTFV